MEIQITDEKVSLLLQNQANVFLLSKLLKPIFLKSAVFNDLTSDNQFFRDVIERSGLGNPAMMLMMLYALLVVPKELLSQSANCEMKQRIDKIDPLIANLAEDGTSSTYPNEENKEKIKYSRHMRNAISHARAHFFSENERNYVEFRDCIGNPAKVCSIKIECYKVAKIMDTLIAIMNQYTTDKINEELKTPNAQNEKKLLKK